MSIAASQVGSHPAHAASPDDAPIHWPSAIVGLVLATALVVGVSWFAAARRPDVRGVTTAAPSIGAPAPEAPIAVAEPPVAAPGPTPAPLIAQTSVADADRLRVGDTRGSGVNLRAAANERATRIKTLAEGTPLELVGPDQRAEGIIWRNVREPGGAVGWVAGTFVVGPERGR